jgi:rfaE bifunctional protein nucleotidyltransferase chain/domain
MMKFTQSLFQTQTMLKMKPITWSEYSLTKTLSPCDIEKKTQSLKAEKKTIVTLNGSFDLLHAGHLHIIYEASLQGDILIVALNSDSSIQKYKSPFRPIIPLEYRLQMVSALSFVSFVTWFEETDPRHILNIIKPDIHVNGAEYGKNCIESETVLLNGGIIHIVELVPGLSTTTLLKKIKNDLNQEK